MYNHPKHHPAMAMAGGH